MSTPIKLRRPPAQEVFDDVVSLRSQEFRAPLASIVGCAELIDTGDINDAQRHLYSAIVIREGRRLIGLVDNALMLRGLESGHQELELAPVDLRSLIQRAVMAAGEDEARPIAVEVTDELPLVAADPEAIFGVLAKFLFNARRFSPDGGVIQIAARPVGDMVEVQIRDHGVGIDAEALPKLFDKFYRPEREARSLGPGAGLGLPLIHRVIKVHGGRVEASSEGVGRGSRFEFSLPVSRPESAAADVLMVEDDPRFARLMTAAFVAHGVSTIRADDAETAEHLLAHITPRAIVLDLALPGLQGEAFLAHVRAGRGQHLPVVALMLENMESAQISALQRAGVMAVLPREAGTPQAVAALIAEALASKMAG